MNLLFFGGIHGSGKSYTIQKSISGTNYIHLTASKVLKWKDLSENPENKSVKNISGNQDILVENLNKIIKEGNNYILDGHFTLLDTNYNITNVPEKTFEAISPKAFFVKTSEPEKIFDRLQERDNKKWNLKLIQNMQSQELDYANYLSKKLNIKLYETNDSDDDAIKDIIKMEFGF